MMDLGFGDVGHAAFSSFAFTPAITCSRAHREAAVVAHRLELLDRHAGLEHQQAAQLPVAVLLDDEVDLVRFEEPADLVAEREAADAHVVDRDPLGGEQIERFDARGVAAADRHEPDLAPRRRRVTTGAGNGARRALDLAIDAIDHLDVLVAVLGVGAEPVVAGAAREVRPVRDARPAACGTGCRRRRRRGSGGTS